MFHLFVSLRDLNSFAVSDLPPWGTCVMFFSCMSRMSLLGLRKVLWLAKMCCLSWAPASLDKAVYNLWYKCRISLLDIECTACLRYSAQQKHFILHSCLNLVKSIIPATLLYRHRKSAEWQCFVSTWDLCSLNQIRLRLCEQTAALTWSTDVVTWNVRNQEIRNEAGVHKQLPWMGLC